MKIVFMGTPEFAVPSLDVLIKNYDVQAVFTQPDRPKGRGKKIGISEVKERALLSDIPVYQPEKIKKSDDIQVLKDLKPDVIVVVAYGQLLSQEILDIPKYGCINVHASLLPKYRGAAPINWAIVNGEKETGATTQYMVKKLDAGDMLQKSVIKITDTMTAGELHDLLSLSGGDLILKTLKAIESGDFSKEAQDESLMTYAPKMDKELAVVNWEKTGFEINCLIRGFNPWPVATTTINGKKMKLFTSTVTDLEVDGKCGEIVNVTKEGIFVNCKDVQLLISEVQMPNKKKMNIEQYILGNSIELGTILGE